jgi:ABC-type lipoprotein release transport system permease subunit
MTTRRLLIQSLIFFWRSHAAVMLCVAVATSVLGGALLVGDSMRGSLRDITLDRLGKVDYALRSDRFFREQLADDLVPEVSRHVAFEGLSDTNPNVIPVTPVVGLRGSMSRVDATGREQSRTGRVQVWGVNSAFWNLGRDRPTDTALLEWNSAGRDSIVLSEVLARELGTAVGDTVLVRVEAPSDIPREASLGRKADTVRTLRLDVVGIADRRTMGSFGLDANQRSPRNAFAPIATLQDSLDIAGRTNTLLVGPMPPSKDPAENVTQALQSALASKMQLDDLGVRLRADAARGYLSLESRRMVLESAIASAAIDAASDLGIHAAPTLSYLANTIRQIPNPDAAGRRTESGYSTVELVFSPLTVASRLLKPSRRASTIPYSIVTALPLDGESPFGRFTLESNEPLPKLAENEILLNTWAAEDLEVEPDDWVGLSYFAAEPRTPFETAEARFRVAGVVEISGAAADPGLIPEYPGVTDAKRYADWDPPFPMDLRRVRPKDEEYWEQYRTTPKAFLPIETGERLWGSRFGTWTSVRFAPRAGRELDELRDGLSRELLARLKPEELGLQFRAVKDEGLAASRGGTDFAQLFLAFSFFLIVSAAILIGLVFRLGVERRARQVGLLLALGLSRTFVRWLFITEGVIVAVSGSLVGLAGAIGYGWLVMAGLRTGWFAAVGSSLLRLHVTLESLVIGAGAGLALAALAIVLALRGLTRLSPRALLAGSVTETMGRPRHFGPAARTIAWVSVVLAFLLAALFIGNAVLLFFVFGAFMLVALLSFLLARVDRADPRPVHGAGAWAVARLGVRNTERHPGRSVLTAGLVAFATFVIVAVGANRRDDQAAGMDRGESWLVAESSVPLLHDLNTSDGRRELGLPDDRSDWMRDVTVGRFRVKEGEDASCLNLYQPTRPRILGVSDDALKQFRYSLSSSQDHAAGSRQTWDVINQEPSDDAVPAIGDANSVKWILHLGLGDRLPVTAEDGRTVDLQIVGLLDRSIFQSELLISEANFRRLFPSQVGYSYFLCKSRGSNLPLNPQLSSLLEQHLSDYGFDATPAADRLAEYHAVENTYLATFQMLGGLGLMLGTLGLGAVLLRGVLERRGELALLLAVGFRPTSLAWLVLSETGYLLVIGVLSGAVSAAAAVTPHLRAHAAEVPWGSLAATLAFVLAFGLASSGAAVLAALRTPLLPALRSE